MPFKLIVNSNNPPVGALLVIEIVRSKLKSEVEVTWSNDLDKKQLEFLNNECALLGKSVNDVCRYMSRAKDPSLYGSDDPFEKSEVDNWLTISEKAFLTPEKTNDWLIYLDRALLTRTWLVAKHLTIADICIFSRLCSEEVLNFKDEKYTNVKRWYKQMLSLESVDKVLKVVSKNRTTDKKMMNGKAKDGAAGKRKQEGKFIDLPGAVMGKVVVRFPPEASGYLHIGHAKAALLNQYYQEAFNGQLIMRFDDTNPAKENVDFEKAILEDLEMLQVKYNRFTHTSDYFGLMLEDCEKLLKEGKAFVDDTPAEEMKEQRDQKLPSKNRDNSVETNLNLWRQMQAGTEKGQQCCVRAKIDYQSPNGCMRDPTIYRCKPEPHPRTGTKYKVYPTYDFACPIVDAIEGVTHTLRTTEYHDRDEQFYWFIEVLGLDRPYIWEYSRLNMTNTVLSKRKLTWLVNEGYVDGWDDPRFPTVRGILRRGMTVEGLKEFIIAQGSSRSVVFMEWDKIWAINKKVIDPIAIRYTALKAKKLVPVHVKGATDEVLTVPNHPKDSSIGTKQVQTSNTILIEREDADALVEGQNATFINWGNLKIEKLRKEKSHVVEVEATLNLDDKDFKNTLKLTWLAQDKIVPPVDKPKLSSIPCYAVYFEHIISKPVLAKDEDFKDFVAKNTRREEELIGESELRRVKKGEIIQLQRKGFFRCDVPYADISIHSSREQPLILFHVPDGHSTAPPQEKSAPKETKATKATKGSKATKENKKVKEKVPVANNEKVFSLNTEITAQGNKVRDLKSATADKSVIDAEVQVLKNLKNDYKTLTGEEWKPPAKVENSKPQDNKVDTEQQVSKDVEVLSQKIAEQGNKVRDLKSKKSDKATIEPEIQALLALKAEYKSQTGQDWKPKPEKTSDTKSNTDKDKKDQEKKMETSEADKINEEIVKQGDKIRGLKSQKAAKDVIDKEVKTLLELKESYKKLTSSEWKPAGGAASQAKPAKASKSADKQAQKPQQLPKDIKETGTRLGLEAKKSENLPDWYSQVITKGEMIEYYDVSGCYILRPWSFAIWDVIKEFFDREIKKLGVQNCYFPIFVSKAALEREKTHIADFAPEVAWVTKSGDSDLAEHIAIRPTSETVMYPAYAKWLKSHRDLPLKLNQWNNVVRWEFKHPQPFLRTREFLWQEGHTAFATKAEADEEVLIILDLYAQIYEDLLAIPVVRGKKTEKEKFAGGDYTTTVEAYISASGRAIQGATSHHLGQNFSKMFDIQVETEGSEKIHVYQNSWGLTTRTIGVMIMVHGDDKGLVLPPKVACVQAVIVPCGITASTSQQQRDKLMAECMNLEKELGADGTIRVKGDYRDNYSPGWKFNHWELKGVPVRVELGFKDLEKNQVTLVRRDNSARVTASRANVQDSVKSLLDQVQANLFEKAKKNLDEHIKQTNDWNQFCTYLDQKNLILAPFCGKIECEDNIKADSARAEDAEPGAPSMGAKSLCIPFKQPVEKESELQKLKCIHCNCQEKPKFFTLFGRSY